ncbi:MAG: amino acid permease [Gemmatimonadota bacterium]|nr:MAG: amino acid permease [Gemmatimonadota bacterium]
MAEKEVTSRGGFGTFKGVFTPSILTILGVIMYLRLGWVLGNVGLPLTLVIVTLASSITFLTGLSIAATATNMRVGIGGAYYMISRSLGLEAGAAIGVPLFFAQALGISFYIVGFAESVNRAFPSLPPTVVGVVTLVVLAALAYKSADLALKTQVLVMAAIALSLASFFAGGAPAEGFATVAEAPAKESFWIVFAVFFPAVTGIEAGIALSGDLKNPARSLPLGTISAVVIGYAIYMAIPIFMARLAPEETLLSDPLVMRRIALWGDAILIGVWGATLSSAMGSLLAAPRTLQALARDRVVPRFLGRGHGAADEPRIATALAFIVALVGIVAGSLNVIAPVLSMFFLTSYGFLNISAGLESLIGSPSWRPQFRTRWWASLLGAFGCFATMFMINPGATFIAAFVSLGVFYIMQRRQMRAYWGDMRHGILTLLARFAVYRLAESKPAARTWRPNILVLSGSPTSRWYLIELADALTHGSGFLTVATIVPEESAAGSRVQKVEATIAEYLRRRGVAALVEVHRADDVLQGAEALVQASGVGPLYPNTIVLGETERPENMAGFAHLIRLTHELQRNMVIVREPAVTPPDRKKRQIHIWWGGQRQNAGLMLALGYLLQVSPEWYGADLSLKSIVSSGEERQPALDRLGQLIEHGRLKAEAEVLVRDDTQHAFDIITAASAEADLVFVGIRPPDPDESLEEYARYYVQLLNYTEPLPATALVLAAEDIEFQRIFE